MKLVLFFAASAALHTAVFFQLGRAPARAARPPALISFEVAPPPPPPVEAAQAHAHSGPPPPRPVRRALAVARPAPVAAPAAAPPAEAPPPAAADFTGVTLTNDAGGWASAVGDGRPSSGPLGPAAAAPAAAPNVVAAADLRRPPEAPPLDEALARNYPADERRQGIAGTAVVRARVLPDGEVRPLRVLAASRPAFADACRRTIAGSRWSAPLDRQARPCATEISYTCRFELDN